MKEVNIPLTSITYAIKAQNVLRARGIRSIIARDERYYSGKSCGYSLVVRTDLDSRKVMDILRENRIKLALPTNEGV